MRFCSTIPRVVVVALFVLAAMSVPWGFDMPRAQISGTSTGWCSDYEGNNFPCSDGGGYSSGGGGGYDYGGGAGCASASFNPEYENSQSFANIGDMSWNEGDYANAAYLYESAYESNSGNDYARRSLGSALNKLGLNASDRGDDLSALLYFERALRAKPESNVIRGNVEAFGYETKSCGTCADAVISDVYYGLGTSAQLYSYVHQATANYKNCTILMSCGGTSGAEFYSLMRDSCMKNFGHTDTGFRGCVSQAVSQYR